MNTAIHGLASLGSSVLQSLRQTYAKPVFLPTAIQSATDPRVDLFRRPSCLDARRLTAAILAILQTGPL